MQYCDLDLEKALPYCSFGATMSPFPKEVLKRLKVPT